MWKNNIISGMLIFFTQPLKQTEKIFLIFRFYIYFFHNYVL